MNQFVCVTCETTWWIFESVAGQPWTLRCENGHPWILTGGEIQIEVDLGERGRRKFGARPE